MLGDRLDELLAWLATSDWPMSVAAAAADACGVDSHEPGVAVDRDWLDNAERRVASAGWGPYGGGTDPMHLAVHSMAPAHGDDDEGVHVLVRDDRRSAVLIVDRYAGWYAALGRLGARLPPRADGRSWKVDVLCRPIGWLGTYRRSRLTGRWFAGRHSTHMMGWSDG